MIRLTVLYNLPAQSDEEEYIAWRLSAHRDYIKSMPGVLRSEFCRITESWPAGTTPEFRFQSSMDWPDRESFDRAFFNEAAQADLRENLKKLGDYKFIVSDVLSN